MMNMQVAPQLRQLVAHFLLMIYTRLPSLYCWGNNLQLQFEEKMGKEKDKGT